MDERITTLGPYGGHNNRTRHEHSDRSTQRGADIFIGHFLLGDIMSDYPPNYSMRPGSAYMDEMEERSRRLAEKPPRRSWRDDARDKGISAYSFDDYMYKLEARRDDDRMDQIMHEAESKLTDAQLCGLPEPETHTCANCGRIGDDSEVIEAKRACGTGYGEWYCMRGQGCQEHK